MESLRPDSRAIRTRWNLPLRWTRVTRSGGWKEALKRGIAVRLAQRKSGYASPYLIAQLYAQAGDKEQAFYWLDTAYRERDLVYQLKTDFTARSPPLRPALRRTGEEGGVAAVANYLRGRKSATARRNGGTLASSNYSYNGSYLHSSWFH